MANTDSRSLPLQHHTMSGNVRKLQEAINFIFDDMERRIFVNALNEYHLDRDVIVFLRKLKFVMNSPEKQRLLPLIRKVIPRSDVETFDLHAQDGKGYGTLPARNRARQRQIPQNYSNKEFQLKSRGQSFDKPHDIVEKASKTKKKKSKSKSSQRPDSSNAGSNVSTLTRASGQSFHSSRLSLQPNDNEVLQVQIGQSPDPEAGFGFSIRGGSQYGLGIYVSMVDRGGAADRQGLQPGDLLMVVNDISFKQIGHEEAAKVLIERHFNIYCKIINFRGAFNFVYFVGIIKQNPRN